MSLEVVTTSLAECSLKEEHSSAAEVYRKGENDPKMPAVEATSFVSPVLGLYLEGGMDIPYSTATLDDCSPYAVGEVNTSVSAERGVLTAAAGIRNDMDSTSLCKCPSLASSPSSIMEDLPRTPPSTSLTLESPSSEGLKCRTEENVNLFEYEKLEEIDTITHLHVYGFWDEYLCLSAPRLLTIALPPEDSI